jgi:RNA polymerase sigma factor (TIGR02999 family)
MFPATSLRATNAFHEAAAMTRSPQQNVTQMLTCWGGGDREVLDKLIPIVYEELRRQAARYLRRERPGNTLQTTGLVHETYLRLVDQKHVQWQNRAHFFGIAAHLMRRILVDHVRMRTAVKRGGFDLKLPLDEAVAASKEREIDLVTLDEALTRLAEIDEQQSRIVELRFFGGLSVEETADVLGVSERTVKRDWQVAKLWLRREIARSEASET